jgi:hypothetical protein
MSANFTAETKIQLSTYVTKIVEPHFIWSGDSAIYFQQALTSPDIRNSLSELGNFNIENPSFSLNMAIDRLQNIVLVAESKSLKKNKTKSYSINTSNKPWYDNNLQYFKKRMINNARIMPQFPRDPFIKGRFLKLKQYAKLCNYKINQFKQSMMDRLDTFYYNNPRAYWNLVNSLLDVKKSKKKKIRPYTLGNGLSISLN